MVHRLNLLNPTRSLSYKQYSKAFIKCFRSLVKLNLSYNQIRNISGFSEMGSSEYRLSQVELHGNRLQSVDHLIQCLRHCTNLRSLAVAQAGADNPLCQMPGKLAQSHNHVMCNTKPV